MKKVAVALAEPPEPPPERKGTRSSIAEWTVTFLMMLFASSHVAWPFVVPTGSMEDTILIGDHLIVDKLSYAPAGSMAKYILPYTQVQRGDIVVFRYPMNIQEDYVKRVIGVPGDRVKIAGKQLYLNGRTVEEPYKVHNTKFLDPYRDFFPSEPNTYVSEAAQKMLAEHVVNGELVVPPDHYFVMGDNRDNSADSRYWGFVPRANIMGKPWIIYWSFDGATTGLSDRNINWTHVKDIATNFFSKTRWSRTFQVIHGYRLE